jgi:hypothetical protein
MPTSSNPDFKLMQPDHWARKADIPKLFEQARAVAPAWVAVGPSERARKVAQLLKARAKGRDVMPVANPLTLLEDHLAAKHKAMLAQNGPTVLAGHSCCGAVTRETGNDRRGTSLVCIAAFAPDRGESVQTLGKGKPPSDGPKAVWSNACGFLFVDPAVFPDVFAGDLPAWQKGMLAADQTSVAAAAFQSKAHIAAWQDKPHFYAISANDRMLASQAESFSCSE